MSARTQAQGSGDEKKIKPKVLHFNESSGEIFEIIQSFANEKIRNSQLIQI